MMETMTVVDASERPGESSKNTGPRQTENLSAKNDWK